MKDTFVLSNAVPQIAPFNSGIWGQLEDGVRDVAFARGEIYVVTGPVRRSGNATSFTMTAAQAGCGHEIKVEGPQIDLVCKAHNANSAAKCKGGVGVPLALYKIIYDAKANEVYAFLMPNRVYNLTGDAQTNLDGFRVTVGALENLTGLQFFPEKPQDQQDHLLKQCETKKFWAPPRPTKKKQ
jgi:DNA/RNA endonuclease G (NUC1)